MSRVCRVGFTLIELLVVIAIISILGGLTAVALPRALERARLTDAASDFSNIRTALATYYTEHQSYPPGYGFILWGTKPGDAENVRYNLLPYLSFVGLFDTQDIYDRFSQSHDTDNDMQLSLLEYSPMGSKAGPGEPLRFPDVVYRGEPPASGVLRDEHDRQMQAIRPYAYAPVNLEQARQVERYMFRRYRETNDLGYMYGYIWDLSDPILQGILNTPPRYDAYVLVSVGPSGSTCGVLTAPADVVTSISDQTEDVYRILALRTYFLATRDANDNKVVDYDWNSRTSKGETDKVFTPRELALMPTRIVSQQRLAGPLLYQVGG